MVGGGGGRAKESDRERGGIFSGYLFILVVYTLYTNLDSQI